MRMLTQWAEEGQKILELVHTEDFALERFFNQLDTTPTCALPAACALPELPAPRPECPRSTNANDLEDGRDADTSESKRSLREQMRALAEQRQAEMAKQQRADALRRLRRKVGPKPSEETLSGLLSRCQGDVSRAASAFFNGYVSRSGRPANTAVDLGFGGATTRGDAEPGMPRGRTPMKAESITRSQLILSHAGDIQTMYTLQGSKIGEGTYGSVAIGVHNSTKAQRAIKTMSKANMMLGLGRELDIAIMKSMDHPNIIKLYETFEDRKHIYLAMELCTGGELFEPWRPAFEKNNHADRIIEVGQFTERDAAITVQQMLSAVFYMHKRQVCHRDLKPENFLFLTLSMSIQGPLGRPGEFSKFSRFGLYENLLFEGSSYEGWALAM
eukprot:g13748.t1